MRKKHKKKKSKSINNKRNTVRNTVRKKTKKTKKKTVRRKSSIKKFKIIDVPFSKKINQGTKASKNKIDYHYQNLNNISDFLHKLYLKKQIKNITFFKDIDYSVLQIDIKNKDIYPYYIELKDFKKYLNICLKNKERFIPISVNSELPVGSNGVENHANILLIDKSFKNIEFFEPHGHKPKQSTYSQSVQKYHSKLKIIKMFFKSLLPNYNIINVVDYIKDKHSFQSKYDSNSGYCVTWSTIYSHYRLINQNVPIPLIIDYLYNLINKNLLLRYARYIEDILKSKL